MDPFISSENPRVLKAIIEAGKRVQSMDEIDESRGAQALYLHPISQQLQTAISAIVCGLELGGQGPGWNEVAEGLVMLSQAEVRVRELETKIDIRMKLKP